MVWFCQKHERHSIDDVCTCCAEEQAAIEAMPERIRALEAELAAMTERAASWKRERDDERDQLRADLERVTRERDDARSFGEDAAAKHNVLLERLKTRDLRCAFCDAEYPPGTPPTQHEALTAHVMECQKHPLRARIKELEAEVERLRSFEHGWQQIEDALGRTEDERARADLTHYVPRMQAELAAARERLASLDELSAIGQELELGDDATGAIGR